MTDQEFDILDELYFVTPFSESQNKLSMSEEDLREALTGLISMNYIKCLYPDPDTEVPYDAAHFSEYAREYLFLASKEGLLAHNSNY